MPHTESDRDMLVQHLLKYKIFASNDGGFHSSFPKPRDVLHSLEHDTIIEWMTTHIAITSFDVRTCTFIFISACKTIILLHAYIRTHS